MKTVNSIKIAIGVCCVASAMSVSAGTTLSCDIEELDRLTGKVTHNLDEKVVVPDQSGREKRVLNEEEKYVAYEEWIINPQASIFRYRGKLDGDMVSLEKSMIEAGTGILRGEIHYKKLGERVKKEVTYRGNCYLDKITATE